MISAKRQKQMFLNNKNTTKKLSGLSIKQFSITIINVFIEFLEKMVIVLKQIRADAYGLHFHNEQ